MIHTKKLNLVLILNLGLVFLIGCTNISSKKRSVSSLNGNPSVYSSTNLVGFTHYIQNINTSVQSGTPNILLAISTNTGVAGYQSLTGFCSTTGSNLCSCELRWNQLLSDGVSTYPRVKRVSAIEVQSGLVKCALPQSEWDEIATGTVIQMNIVPILTNATGLNAQALSFKKGTTVSASGDFLDSTLTPFRNIYRYTCHTKRRSAHEILNSYTQVSGTDAAGNATQYNLQIGSRFCVGASTSGGGNANGSSGSSGGGDCPTVREGFSAQNYYRNLFIRSDKLGSINSTNNSYDCEKVVESVKSTLNGSIPQNEQGKYWPLDTSFALATEKSSEWSVPVSAAAHLTKTTDPAIWDQRCPGESGRLYEKGLLTYNCLGYAKKPKNDGSCGTVQDSNGQIRPMVRLRRYHALLPATFKSNGEPDTIRHADEVYVADRLVLDSNGLPTNEMIYGPKPCNYSWFDHEGLVNRDGIYDFESRATEGAIAGGFARPAYVATNKFHKSTGWTSAADSYNPDGLFLPNLDKNGTVNSVNAPSCSATIPIVRKMLGSPDRIELITTNQGNLTVENISGRSFLLNELHIQPIDPWTLNYVEDTSFNACVPAADPYIEPPLHIYKESATSYGWCSKVYPTQNPYWNVINKKRKHQASNDPSTSLVNFTNAVPGDIGTPVKGFTSHDTALAGPLDSYNSCVATGASKICSMSGNLAGCTTYLGKYIDTGVAVNRPANTCDRTALFDTNQEYRDFPLQAEDADVDAMLSSDLSTNKSFSCHYSVTSDTNKLNKKSPGSGCCGLVNNSPLLNGLPIGSGGHLEPYVNALYPNVRFCGSPVQ